MTEKIFLLWVEEGGAGGIWGGGGGGDRKKKTAFKGGPSKKIREKGGHVKYFSSALRWDACYYS